MATWMVGLALVALLPSLAHWAVRATVVSIQLISHVLRLECIVAGSHVRLAGADLAIVGDCTSLMPTLALWAAMWAFPATARWRAGGVVIGATLLWLYNLVRVFALVVILRSRPSWFEFVHAYLWQTATLFIVLVMYVLWIWMGPGRARM